MGGTETPAEGTTGEGEGALTAPRTREEQSVVAEVEEEGGATVVVTEAEAVVEVEAEEVDTEIQTVTPEVEEGTAIMATEATLTITGRMEVVRTFLGAMGEVVAAAAATIDSTMEPTVVIGVAVAIMVTMVTVLIMEVLLGLTVVAITEIVVVSPAVTVPTAQATRTCREVEAAPTSTTPGTIPTAAGK